DVTNVGSGKALDAFAQIKNAADQNIFIDKGRFKLGELAPGETKTARFQLEVKRAFKDAAFPLKLAIVDEPLQELTSEKLAVPVNDGAITVDSKKGLVRAVDKAELLDAPDANARVIARLGKGATLAVTGRSAGFTRVELDKGRFAFLRAADAKDVKGKPLPVKDVEYLMSRTPPLIALNTDAQQGGLVVDSDKFTLSGTASDPNALLDLYVLVNDQKVFFKSASPPEKGGASIAFSTDFPLKDGNNYVMVVARESTDFGSRKGLVIRRRSTAVAQQVPKAAAAKD
ncbi:MAG TPA: peptidase S41, partial [Myxococcaceae bacterium]|nr:peptidase S41 [Myxococcaceae bacterium]